MKTTMELDDALLTEAKVVAARRRTTLRALVEHALRRELQPAAETVNPDPERFVVGPLGLLRIRRQPGERIALEGIRAVQDEFDEEEFRRALNPGRP